MLTPRQKNQHLMWRAGFGPAAAQLQQLDTIQPENLFRALQKASARKPDYMDVADNYLKGLAMGIGELGRQNRKTLDEDEKKMVRQKQRESIRNLNLQWLSTMVTTDAQLREKMAFFWHGHFASRNINIFFQQQLLDIIRTNALGSFRDLLHEVSKSAAILNFLNAAQNRKGHPNENFAREVMELFTMGRGHYTEQDIKEAARAFTGWSANAKGEFVMRKMQHDEGGKTILEKKGNFGGEEVLDLLLAQKATASFIAGKIYRFFVNENGDPKHIAWLADRFYKSDYHIGALMEDIFTADWFYDEKNIGRKINSPIELLAGLQRMLPMQIENEEALLLLQRVMGQLLFYPPNVAGWPGGTAWIDSSTLMLRLRLPQLVNEADELNLQPKTDDDQAMGRMEELPDRKMGKIGKPIRVQIDWDRYTKHFESIPREQLLSALTAGLLQVKPGFSPELLKTYADSHSREAFIKTATLRIMGTPEYQLC
jgi:uncharacterized protein (DUF1800 family)